ncbi:MAG: HEAT repeat domain-containing protein [Bacillota bacterium]|nr:HEAT repeat domain-containing protein [Bacillota bacterium]
MVGFGKPNIERLRQERDVEGLIKELRHEDWRVRFAVARALYDIGDARAVQPLIAVLKDPHVCGPAAAALSNIGRPAVEPLMGVLRDEAWHARELPPRRWGTSVIPGQCSLSSSPSATRARA